MEWTVVIQIILGGVLLGGIYGLLSLGMSLNISLLNIINLAHGSFLILGGLAGCALTLGWGLPPLSGLILIPLLFGGSGRLLYPLFLDPFFNREPAKVFVSFLLFSLGLAFILEDVSAAILSHPLIGLQSGISSWHWKGLILSPLAVLLLLVLSGVILALVFLLLRTDLGRSLRALAQDPEGAVIVGVPLQRTRAWAWALGLSAAGLAGVFWVLLFPLTPFIGLKITIMSLLMVMGVGADHLSRSLGAGFFWGFLESTGSALWGPRWGLLVPLMVFLTLVSFFPKGLKITR